MEIDGLYSQERSTLKEALKAALQVSRQTTGIETDGTQKFWASVLFTKLLVNSITILNVSPNLEHPKNADSRWDYSATASLTRNLAETYLMFFYLCIDEVSDQDEWLTRLNLIQLRDHVSRTQIFNEWGSQPSLVDGRDPIIDDLKRKLQSRRFFQSLGEKEQRELLKGNKAVLLTQDELLKRMKKAPEEFRGWWRYLSAHTHSMPISFLRMAEDGRGCGKENTVEKGIMSVLLEMVSNIVEQATDEIRLAFAEEMKAKEVLAEFG